MRTWRRYRWRGSCWEGSASSHMYRYTAGGRKLCEGRVTQWVTSWPTLQLLLHTMGDGETRGQYRGMLEGYLRPQSGSLSEDSRRRLDTGAVLRILDSKDPADKEVVRDAPALLDCATPAWCACMATSTTSR